MFSLMAQGTGQATFIISLTLLVVWILGFAWGAARVWDGKGGSYGAGFFLGFFLGPIGLIITMIGTPGRPSWRTRQCPHCMERIDAAASVCPHCQRESPAWVEDTRGRFVPPAEL